MKFITEIVGFLEVNCYIIPSEKDNCVYVIDPGASPDKVAKSAESLGYSDYKIILTHAHIDHVSAVKDLMTTLKVSSLYLHEDDMPLYTSPANELLPFMPAVANPPVPIHDMKNCEFRIIHTPGHTRGGVCYYFEGEKSLFSGDTLFRESIGRTDLPGGNTENILSSIKERLFSLPEDVVVYPGHGSSTTIAYEKKSNPYISMA